MLEILNARLVVIYICAWALRRGGRGRRRGWMLLWLLGVAIRRGWRRWLARWRTLLMRA